MRKTKFKLSIQYNSPVILTFTFLSLAVLLLNYIFGGYLIPHFFSVYRSSPTDIFTYVRMFSHVLGHSDFNHYLNNFLIILLVGPVTEEKYGSRNILMLILLTAFVTGFTHIIFSSNSSLLGASGIAFMLIILCSAANFVKGTVPLTLILVATLYIGQEVVYGIILNDNISRLAHITGALCGLGGSFVLGNGSRY